MSLITPTEVSSIAFVNALDPALILPEFIASASTKFVVPVVTQSVLDSIDAAPGDYTTLVDDYIKPYLAFAVKYMFYNQLLTETQLFPTSDDQRVAAIQEILSILEIKRDLLKTYLNDNIFESPVTETKPTVAGIFLSSSKPAAASSDPNTDVASTLNAASVATLSDADTLNFIQFTTGLLRKLSWSNFKATLKNAFDSIYSAIDHNHNADYAAISHDHDTDYAVTDHDHDSDYAAINHAHSGMISSVTDGMFNLDATSNTLTVAPYTAAPSPIPSGAYFRSNPSYLPQGQQPLVLDGQLTASRIFAWNGTYVPIEGLSAGYNLPAGKFVGGVDCSASMNFPVMKLHFNVGGTSALPSVLLQITRDIFDTIIHNQPIININDDPVSPNVTGELLKATIDSILRINLNPRVPDGSSAVAYMLDTRNNLSDAAALLLSIRNQGVEKLSLSASGNLSVPAITVNGQAGVSGSFTSAEGKTITVTNGIISSII
jgi:hypothetical protein